MGRSVRTEDRLEAYPTLLSGALSERLKIPCQALRGPTVEIGFQPVFRSDHLRVRWKPLSADDER